MIRFRHCTRAGHTEGDLLLELEADDGTRYACAITPECFIALFTMGWKAAQNLPPAAREGQGPTLETTAASFAVVNLQPALALLSGPLVLTLGVTPAQMEYLQKEYRDFLAGSGRDQTH